LLGLMIAGGDRLYLQTANKRWGTQCCVSNSQFLVSG